MNMAKRTIDPDAAPRSAFVLDDRHAAIRGLHWHAHRRAQLVHAAEGVLTVHTEAGRWVVPPERGVWIPGGTVHAVTAGRPFRLLTLYCKGIELTPRVVAVDRLAAELLHAAAAFGPAYPRGGPEERLVRVLLDRLPFLATTPILHLPEPADPRLRKITAAITRAPADTRTLDELSRRAGITSRTAARRFVAETGLTFGRWRQQSRFLAALDRLAAGTSVTATAFEVGYDDVSSFISAFRSTMGTTPARYYADRNATTGPRGGATRSPSTRRT